MRNESGALSELFVLRSDSFPMNPDKKTLIPYIYDPSNKYLFLSQRIQNSRRNRHLTLFYEQINFSKPVLV